jgi:hypothetical protein
VLRLEPFPGGLAGRLPGIVPAINLGGALGTSAFFSGPVFISCGM